MCHHRAWDSLEIDRLVECVVTAGLHARRITFCSMNGRIGRNRSLVLPIQKPSISEYNSKSNGGTSPRYLGKSFQTSERRRERRKRISHVRPTPAPRRSVREITQATACILRCAIPQPSTTSICPRNFRCGNRLSGAYPSYLPAFRCGSRLNSTHPSCPPALFFRKLFQDVNIPNHRTSTSCAHNSSTSHI